MHAWIANVSNSLINEQWNLKGSDFVSFMASLYYQSMYWIWVMVFFLVIIWEYYSWKKLFKLSHNLSMDEKESIEYLFIQLCTTIA